jgi:hypothetical protein
VDVDVYVAISIIRMLSIAYQGAGMGEKTGIELVLVALEGFEKIFPRPTHSST